MKKYVLFVIAITLSINNVLGQLLESEECEKVSDTKVTSVREIDDIKTVILLENENFFVKVALSSFEENIRNWLKEQGTTLNHYSDDKKLLDRVLNEAKSADTVNVSKITEIGMVSSLKFRMASLLENGKCFILSNKSNEIITEIKLQQYSRYRGPSHVCDGRRFYVNEILILETQDIVTVTGWGTEKKI